MYCIAWHPAGARRRRRSGTHHQLDMAIVDQMMPTMTGEGLARAIKSNPRIADVSLVLYTSSSQRGDAERVNSADFAGYLVKPTRTSVLKDALATICAARRHGVSVPLVTSHTVREQRALQSAPAQTAPDRDSMAMRVLLVEDNPVNQ